MGYADVDSQDSDAASFGTKSQQPHYGPQQQSDEMMNIDGVRCNHSGQIHQAINFGRASHGEKHFHTHAILIECASPRECNLEMKSSPIKLRHRHRTLTSSSRLSCQLEAQNAIIINNQALEHWETHPGRKPFYDTSPKKGAGCSGPENFVYLARLLGLINEIFVPGDQKGT